MKTLKITSTGLDLSWVKQLKSKSLVKLDVDVTIVQLRGGNVSSYYEHPGRRSVWTITPR